MLEAEGIACEALAKDSKDLSKLQATDVLHSGQIDLVINIPRDWDEKGRPDGYRIRRAAVDLEIPLLTDQWLARKTLQAMSKYREADLPVVPWNDYLGRARSL